MVTKWQHYGGVGSITRGSVTDGWSKETLVQKISGPYVSQTENWTGTQIAKLIERKGKYRQKKKKELSALTTWHRNLCSKGNS